MESRPVRYILAAIVVFVLVVGAFAGGVFVGVVIPGRLPGSSSNPSLPPVSQTTPAPSAIQKLFEPFWQAWDLVHKEFVNQPVNDETLMQGAIRGMLDSLGDQHTTYLSPSQYTQATTTLQGEYEGIGAWVDATKDFLTIITPMPGYPAEKAGLKTGDQIIAVDGVDVTGTPPDLILPKVRGPAGTTVKLTIRREGEKDPLQFEIMRAKVNVPSVTGKMLDNNIAYVQITTFGDQTVTELTSTLTDLMSKKPVGMVIDLRNNGGGYLDTAIKVMSQFIDKGALVNVAYGNGKTETFNALGGGLATNILLVVLVNKGSASASEVTAGAIQDYGRGQLVGEVTYGKGSVQNWSELSTNEGAVRITIAHWLTPKNRQIDGTGLTPDVLVARTDADIAANLDPQLDQAVQILSNPK
jgi:carboxyl-terminal processing protease